MSILIEAPTESKQLRSLSDQAEIASKPVHVAPSLFSLSLIDIVIDYFIESVDKKVGEGRGPQVISILITLRK